MLKGKQKNIDKNKDGKITGEDFKMMKAKYGKMTKANKGKMAEDKLKTLGEIAKVSIVGSGALAGAQATAKEIKELMKQVPKKSTGGKMMKARKGKMVKANKGIMAKKPEKIKSLRQSATLGYYPKGDMPKKSMGGEMKSTQGYGAARTSGMGLQDEDLIPGKSMDYYKDLM